MAVPGDMWEDDYAWEAHLTEGLRARLAQIRAEVASAHGSEPEDLRNADQNDLQDEPVDDEDE